MAKNKCNCTTHYLFTGKPQCLHKLFAAGVIKAVVREATPYGVYFYMYATKPKGRWWLNGSRSQIKDVTEAKLAIELANKHNIRKVRV